MFAQTKKSEKNSFKRGVFGVIFERHRKNMAGFADFGDTVGFLW